MFDRIRATLVSIRCVVRALPLFFAAAPKTPLRVFGIITLDTLHRLRHSRPLPQERINALALFMDFEGCANAAWDRKDLCDVEYQIIRQRLEQAGLGLCVEEHLRQLRALESQRPSVGGDDRRFDEVRSYREGVARLSIATAAAIALSAECTESGIRLAQCDTDVDLLFRILMQCQIIDDVLDYEEDLSAGLPSFLTACASVTQALELTADAARHYRAGLPRSSSDGVFPLRMALTVITALTIVGVRVASLAPREAFAHFADSVRLVLRAR